MRAKVRIGVRAMATGMVAAALGAALAACFDLFHSTSGIVSACDLDVQSCTDAGPQVDGAAGDSGTDFCAFTPIEAVAHAQHACAWLGACETPMGSNAFGTCMFDALLAYDCNANPNHPVRGATYAFWDCLRQVGNCGDVTKCVFPGGVPSCKWNGRDFTACASAGGSQYSSTVRIECIDVDGGLAVGEDCADHGQTCSSADGGASCTGSAGLSCANTGCSQGSQLHQCSGGSDMGIDCASNGAGRCGGFPGGDAGNLWVACVASGDAGCAPTQQATCVSGYATSCPSGVPESVYCPELLQTTGNACVDGTLLPPFDWTSPCVVSPPTCTTDSCDADGGVIGCARGATYPLDCASQGLGPCTMVITDEGTQTHAACTPLSP
jgi:hypothetical protein